jgi:YidC/Oxa1 family membrane protein insertase
MNDTRRFLLAFLLVLIILFLWTALPGLNRRRAQPTPAQPPAAAGQPTRIPPAASAPAPVVKAPAAPTVPERLDTLENAVLRAVFSSHGGTIRSVWLKRYRAELVPAESRSAGIGLLTGDDYRDLSDVAMNVVRTESTVEYAGLDPLGEVTVSRRYALGPDYLLTVDIGLTGPNSGYFLLFRNGSAVTEKHAQEDINNMNLLAVDKTTHRYGGKQTKNVLHLGNGYRWVGMKSMYFLTALCSPAGLDTVVAAQLADRRIGWLAGVHGPRSLDRYQLYFGPLEYNILRRAGLHAAFDFGKFLFVDLAWIGLPILKFLQLLYNIVRNFGLALIIFAIVMKAVFYPLSRIQTKQMRTMAQLQPKIAEVKKRYKNNPEAVNRETMQLYRLYKVNPLSGCLPLLIQMPIFFALYQVLRSGVDLRQAPFVFWITDLSLKDPYYVLPILMGVFSILQSFITSVGQTNKLLTIMMPIFITVIFLNFPSGLQLYWLVFNILSIVESLIAQGGFKWPAKPRTQPASP